MELPIPSDWDGETFCELAVCWPDSIMWRGILHALLEQPTQGRFWDFSTGDFLALKAAFAVAYDANFNNLEEVLVSCNDDKFMQLIAALTGISVSAGAAATADCGCPGGTSPASQPGVEGGEPPDGFEDTGDEPGTPEALSRKCAVANLVWRWVRDGLTALSVSGVGDILSALISGGIGLAVAYLVSLLTLLTFGWVLAIIGVAALLAETIISSSIDLGALLTIINDNESDLVCALYTATSQAEAEAAFIQVCVDNGASTGHEYILAGMFLIPDVTNQLFFAPTGSARALALSSAIDGLTGAVDCAACACNEFVLLLGSYNSETGVLSSQANGGAHKIAIMFNTTAWAYDWETTKEFNCGPMAIPEFGSISGGSPVSSFAYEVVGDDVMDLYASSSVMWSNPGQHGRSFWLVRNAAFTVPLVGVENYEG